MEGNKPHSIDSVKQQVLDTSLVVASIAGTIAYIFSTTSRILSSYFGVSTIANTLVLLAFIIITIQRKRIRNSVKAYIIVLLILILSLTDSYVYGLFSTTRIYLMLIPLFTLVYFSFSASIVIYSLAITGFVSIGYFHHVGVLSVPPGYEPIDYIQRLFPWIINAIHITTASLIILYIILKFFKSFSELILNLEENNAVIKESERNYREIFNSTNEAILIHNNTDGSIIDVNDVMLRMFGIPSKEEAQKLSVKDLSAKSDNESQRLALELIKNAVDGKPQVFEWKSKKISGEAFYTEISLKSTKIGGEGRVLAVVRDITERKLAEKAISDSEEKYRTLMESLNEVIIVADNNHVVQFVNKRFTEKLGYEPDEIIGKVGYKILHDPEDQALIEQANIKRVSKYTSHYELTFIAKDGNRYEFLVNGAPIVDANGNTIASIGAMIDITEFNKARMEIQESEERYRTLFENAQIGIYQTTPEGKILKANPAIVKMLGYNSYEDLSMLNVETKDAFFDSTRKTFKDIIERDGFVENFESIWKTKYGDQIFVVENARAVRDSQGKTLYYDGFATNVTDRKIAEIALKESEERYKTIIDAFPDIIMISDLQSNILFGNNVLEKVTGITPSDYVNPNRKPHIHPDDLHLVKDAIKNLVNSDAKHSPIIENRFIDAWGKTHWFNGIMSKVYINNKLYLQTISRDVTEKKMIEHELDQYRNRLELLVKERTEELAAANEELKATNEELYSQREELESTLNKLQNTQQRLIQSEKMASLGLLAAGVAHEINNPLNFIKGGALAIENYFSENLNDRIEEIKPWIEILNVGVKRAADIVTSLNHYSRKTESMTDSYNIHGIIDNCITMIHNQIKDRIEIVKDYTNSKISLVGNEGKIHQAILNILTNAFQSIEGKGSITISTSTNNNKFSITVSDTGCGINPENLNRVTDPFFTTKDPGKGTGLGLAITQNIIEEHKGSIEFWSEVGVGTKVFVYLPMKSELHD